MKNLEKALSLVNELLGPAMVWEENRKHLLELKDILEENRHVKLSTCKCGSKEIDLVSNYVTYTAECFFCNRRGPTEPMAKAAVIGWNKLMEN